METIKEGNLGLTATLSVEKRLGYYPRGGFEAKIRALGFLVLGNLGYSLY